MVCHPCMATSMKTFWRRQGHRQKGRVWSSEREVECKEGAVLVTTTAVNQRNKMVWSQQLHFQAEVNMPTPPNKPEGWSCLISFCVNVTDQQASAYLLCD